MSNMFYHAGLLSAVLAAVGLPCRMIEHQPQFVCVHVDFSERPLHRLALGQVGAESLALFGVGGSQIEAALHDAEAARAVTDAPGIEPRLRVPETVALVA